MVSCPIDRDACSTQRLRRYSSAGQSEGFINPRSQVRVLLSAFKGAHAGHAVPRPKEWIKPVRSALVRDSWSIPMKIRDLRDHSTSSVRRSWWSRGILHVSGNRSPYLRANRWAAQPTHGSFALFTMRAESRTPDPDRRFGQGRATSSGCTSRSTVSAWLYP